MKIKNLFGVFAMMFALSATLVLSSCSKDDEGTLDVTNTTWESLSSYSDGSSTTTQIQFSANTATYVTTYYEGSNSSSSYAHFNYRQSNNLVVLTPQEAGKATLECSIDVDSKIKMTVTNMSNNKVIATLYKRR